MAEIQIPDNCVGAIYRTLSQRRGIVISEEPIQGTPLLCMRAHLPVGESFGLTESLRQSCGGRAFPNCTFSHWQQMSGDPLEVGSKSNTLIETIRKRKGLKTGGIPALDNFIDKL